jgi:hypothetical protein
VLIAAPNWGRLKSGCSRTVLSSGDILLLGRYIFSSSLSSSWSVCCGTRYSAPLVDFDIENDGRIRRAGGTTGCASDVLGEGDELGAGLELIECDRWVWADSVRRNDLGRSLFECEIERDSRVLVMLRFRAGAGVSREDDSDSSSRGMGPGAVQALLCFCIKMK